MPALTLDDIRAIFDQPASGASSILRRRLLALNAEVNKIRTHQQAIGRLLQKTSQMRRTEMMTKDKWGRDHARHRL